MSQGEDRTQSALTATRILLATVNATPGRPSALAFPSSSPSSMLRVRACMALQSSKFSFGLEFTAVRATRNTNGPVRNIGTSRRALESSSRSGRRWEKIRNARPRTRPTPSGCPRRYAHPRGVHASTVADASVPFSCAAARSATEIWREPIPTTDSTPPTRPYHRRSAS